MKPSTYYYVLMVDFTPYKCTRNGYKNGVSESNEHIFIHLWRPVMHRTGCPKKSATIKNHHQIVLKDVNDSCFFKRLSMKWAHKYYKFVFNILCLVSGVAQWSGRRSVADGLSPDLRLIHGWRATTSWVRRPLWINQLGQLSLPSLRGR